MTLVSPGTDTNRIPIEFVNAGRLFADAGEPVSNRKSRSKGKQISRDIGVNLIRTTKAPGAVVVSRLEVGRDDFHVVVPFFERNLIGTTWNSSLPVSCADVAASSPRKPKRASAAPWNGCSRNWPGRTR